MTLVEAGFHCAKPDGVYYIMADIRPFFCKGIDTIQGAADRLKKLR